MSALVRWLNDTKLRSKLIVSFIVVALVPVLIAGAFLTIQLRKVALADAVERCSSNVQRVAKQTLQMMSVAVNISNQLLIDNRLETVVNTDYPTLFDVVQAYRTYPDLDNYVQLYHEIDTIRLYVNNPTLLNNWEIIPLTSEITRSSWYKNALTHGSLIDWEYLKDERDGLRHLSLVRKIAFLKHKTYGVLVININTAMLDSLLREEPFQTMIVDHAGNIVASNRAQEIGRRLSDISLSNSAPGREDGSANVIFDGKPSKVFVQRIRPQESVDDLRVLSVFSVESIVKGPNQVITVALGSIAAGLVVALLLIFRLSNLLTNRLLKLSRHIALVKNGALDLVADIDGKDEIGQLSGQFNSMLENLNELIIEVESSHQRQRQLEAKQSEIRFKMMASQINPHFLFNALESIRMKAHLQGAQDIAGVVKSLGRILRMSLDAGNEKIPLRQEVEMADCYMNVQKFRYEDRLKYEFHVDRHSQEILIPPLIIQPLLENSVRHGLENAEGGCRVVLIVATDYRSRCVRISVQDNGSGIDESRLKEVIASLESDDGTGRIGLRNVHTRLVLSYGPFSGLAIWSRPGEGTRVEFAIPLEVRDV